MVKHGVFEYLSGHLKENCSMELISVIVPVYKVEKYLNQCIKSIVMQSYKNLEILLIDDGSPDRCGLICDEWKKRDMRIKVIHKENEGLSKARNDGLNMSKGKYIVFVDSDDLIAPKMIEILFLTLKQKNADIVECDYLCFSDSILIRNQKRISASVTYSTEEALSLLLDEEVLKYTVWNKLYRKEVLRHLRFEVGKIHEDVFFTYQAIGASRKIVKVNDCLYYYRQRSGSIMNIGFSIQSLDSLEARKRQYFYIKENYPLLSMKAQSKMLENCLYFGQKVLLNLNSKEKNKAFHIIKVMFDEIYMSRPVRNSILKRIWYMFAKTNLLLCCRIRNIMKIGI